MSYSLLLVLYYSIKIYILHAFENVGFHKGIGLFKFSDKILDLKALGIGASIII